MKNSGLGIETSLQRNGWSFLFHVIEEMEDKHSCYDYCSVSYEEMGHDNLISDKYSIILHRICVKGKKQQSRGSRAYSPMKEPGY